MNNTLVDAQVESVRYSTTKLVASEPNMGVDFNGDGDMVDAEYNIGPDSSLNIRVTINSADDALPGEVKVTLNFHRTYKYV